MYTIQAHNLQSKRIEVYRIDSHAEKMLFVKSLRENPTYGLIEEFYNARY
jgi:hypothetical protein